MNDQQTLARKKTLSEVRQILAATSVRYPIFNSDPRTQRSFFWAAPFAIVGTLVGFIWLGAVAAIGVFFYVRAKTPAETWAERFCRLLTSYQPADEAEFRVLLEKIKANTAQREDILMWLHNESAHVDRPNEVAAEKLLLQRLGN